MNDEFVETDDLLESVRRKRAQALRVVRLMDEMEHRLIALKSGRFFGMRLGEAIIHLLRENGAPLTRDEIYLELKAGGAPMSVERGRYTSVESRQRRDVTDTINTWLEDHKKIPARLRDLRDRVGLIEWPTDKWDNSPPSTVDGAGKGKKLDKAMAPK